MEKKELEKYGKVIENPSMKDYTTYKIGGCAKYIIFPEDENKLVDLLKYLHMEQEKYKVIGNGSNLIFSDDGFDGVIIKLNEFSNLEIDGNVIKVGAGYNLMRLALKLSRSGYKGLEFAAGIPGSIGGAIFMNAGAYGSDMGYIAREVKVITPEFEIKTLSNKEMNFHYRTSFLKENPKYICLEATLYLEKGNEKEIMELINDRKKRRVESQPLSYPSAGSVFRNPTGTSAWKLVETAGFKGKKIGGALVSPIHANFIVNDGNASAKDVKELITEIKKEVKEKYDIDLKEEQEFVDR